MDNQQERLAYTAGVIDSEGWVGFRKQQARSGNHADHYIPNITITMVDPEGMEEIYEIARQAGMPAFMQHLRSGATRITCLGLRRMAAVLPILIPHLVIKRLQAQWVLEFSESRLDRAPRGHKRPYSDRELEIVRNVSILNHKGKGSEIKAAARILRGYTSEPQQTARYSPAH